MKHLTIISVYTWYLAYSRCKATIYASIIMVLWACVTPAYSYADDYPLVFVPQGDTFIVEGIIDERALEAFAIAIEENPRIQSLTLQYVPGSDDDTMNLMLARIIHSMGFETIVPDGGLISSGGTDLFLAGKKRSLAANACVGVHSWDDDELGQGADIPKRDPNHHMYLKYYRDIGIDTEFYWFTLQAASAEGMHWMTRDELKKYNIGTIGHAAIKKGSIHKYCEQLADE